MPSRVSRVETYESWGLPLKLTRELRVDCRVGQQLPYRDKRPASLTLPYSNLAPVRSSGVPISTSCAAPSQDDGRTLAETRESYLLLGGEAAGTSPRRPLLRGRHRRTANASSASSQVEPRGASAPAAEQRQPPPAR